MKLNKAIERNVILGKWGSSFKTNKAADIKLFFHLWLLENEISTKDNLTEQAQRLKDELNGKKERKEK
jgi:hypothetical protein